MLDHTIDVNLDGVPYPIYLGKGLGEKVGLYLSNFTKNKSVILIYDRFFENDYSDIVFKSLSESGFSTIKYALDSGKGNKNFSEALKIYALLEENNIARDSTIISLGGGVIGDMAGFVASTWLRGMNLVHIPTTMVAMVDSSIGGKTAINFRKTINGIGSYYHPIFNIIDFDLIDTLPKRDYESGIAEIIKCAVISDQSLFTLLLKDKDLILSKDRQSLFTVMRQAIDIKIKHVQGDVKEGGKRLLLNYGHTLGHSLEISTEKNGQEQLRHGEGVAVGMVAASFIAQEHLGKSKDDLLLIESVLNAYNLPSSISAADLGFSLEDLLSSCKENVHKDKKRLADKLRLILSESVGQASVYNDVNPCLVEDAFEYVVRK